MRARAAATSFLLAARKAERRPRAMEVLNKEAVEDVVEDVSAIADAAYPTQWTQAEEADEPAGWCEHSR